MGAGRAHHIEVVVLLRPLVVAWGLHGGCIRGGLIACWGGPGAMRALSRGAVEAGTGDCGVGCAASGPRSTRMSRGSGNSVGSGSGYVGGGTWGGEGSDAWSESS